MDSPPMDVVPLQVITELINNVKSLDLSQTDIKEVRLLVKKLTFFYPVVRRGIFPNRIYRVRKNSNEKFTNISELWYPPAHFISKYGRLNDVGQAVFYGSDQEAVAISETRPQPGEILTIIECGHRGRSLQLKELGLLPESSADIEARSKVLGNTENVEKYNLIRELLHKEFTQIVNLGDEYRYKITVSIAYWLMSNSEADGIMYPSIETGLMGVNYALKPEIADMLLYPIHAKMILIERKLSPIGYEGRVLSQAQTIESDGTIIWQ